MYLIHLSLVTSGLKEHARDHERDPEQEAVRDGRGHEVNHDRAVEAPADPDHSRFLDPDLVHV